MNQEFWDENDSVSEFDLIQDEIEEAEALAEAYENEPPLNEPSQEDVDQIMEDSAFELDEEESGVIYNARLRLEQAKLYEMLINHDLFEDVDADPEAVKNVQNELKHYIVKRLEILMGLRKPGPKPQEKVDIELPFNDIEVDFLKQLAYKGTQGRSSEGEPVQSTTKTQSDSEINSIGTTQARKSPSLKPLSSKSSNRKKSKQSEEPQEKVNEEVEQEQELEEKPAQQTQTTTSRKKTQKPTRNTQKATTSNKKKTKSSSTKQKTNTSNTTKKSTKQKQPAKQTSSTQTNKTKQQPTAQKKKSVKSGVSPRSLSKKEIEELAKQDAQNMKNRKPWAQMTKKEKQEEIKRVNNKYIRKKPENALPQPSANELEMKYRNQQQNLSMSNDKTNQFNYLLANQLAQQKNREEGD